MFECSALFREDYNRPRRLPLLERNGDVKVTFSGNLGGKQIKNILIQIHFIISTYGRACKRVLFICNGTLKPIDMFSYVLLETFVYTLKFVYGYNVEYRIDEVKSGVNATGIGDSLLKYFFDNKFDPIKMEKYYRKIHTKNHFRRVISCEDIGGASEMFGELKIFLTSFSFGNGYDDKLAKVAAELVDNACEHAEADCLLDLYISDATYAKEGSNDLYYAINMVVINFSQQKFCAGIKRKIENKDYKDSARYEMVSRALENHNDFFSRGEYEIEDFYNIAAFQDRISGRSNETETGGTGLTELIKSLEDKAEAHSCYVLSGDKGLWFEPKYLRYNEDDWIGFNEDNDFIKKGPDKAVLVSSDVDFLGTGYNFVLIVKKEETFP